MTQSRPEADIEGSSPLSLSLSLSFSICYTAPPNNLGMNDPSLQFRANDLLSNPNTEPVSCRLALPIARNLKLIRFVICISPLRVKTKWGDPVSSDELERIKQMANKLAK